MFLKRKILSDFLEFYSLTEEFYSNTNHECCGDQTRFVSVEARALLLLCYKSNCLTRNSSCDHRLKFALEGISANFRTNQFPAAFAVAFGNGFTQTTYTRSSANGGSRSLFRGRALYKQAFISGFLKSSFFLIKPDYFTVIFFVITSNKLANCKRSLTASYRIILNVDFTE